MLFLCFQTQSNFEIVLKIFQPGVSGENVLLNEDKMRTKRVTVLLVKNINKNLSAGFLVGCLET